MMPHRELDIASVGDSTPVELLTPRSNPDSSKGRGGRLPASRAHPLNSDATNASAGLNVGDGDADISGHRFQRWRCVS